MLLTAATAADADEVYRHEDEDAQDGQDRHTGPDNDGLHRIMHTSEIRACISRESTARTAEIQLLIVSIGDIVKGPHGYLSVPLDNH